MTYPVYSAEWYSQQWERNTRLLAEAETRIRMVARAITAEQDSPTKSPLDQHQYSYEERVAWADGYEALSDVVQNILTADLPEE